MSLTSPEKARLLEAHAKTEVQFLQEVIELAQGFGWLVHHCRPAQTRKGWRTPVQGTPGFPDLVLCKAPRIIMAELKREGGKLTAPQKRWLNEFGRCGHFCGVYIWTPSMWDQVVEVLRKKGDQC